MGRVPALNWPLQVHAMRTGERFLFATEAEYERHVVSCPHPAAAQVGGYEYRFDMTETHVERPVCLRCGFLFLMGGPA